MASENTDFEGFAEALVAWQHRFGRHGLPWMVPTPYERWLSEIMLQQTQVPVVLEYFRKFLKAFPTLKDLAQADESEVLRLWSGMGYYTRARNLSACAKMIARNFGGKFPEDIDALQTLPGIGRSTAGAIASFCFGKPTPILDGNVKRVFSRLLAMEEPVESTAAQKRLWIFAEERISHKTPGVYNQALMDLGSGICTKTKPQCETCPIAAWCLAYKLDRVEDFPVRKKRAPKPTREGRMLLICQGNQVWLEKRTQDAVWKGLWSLPEIDKAAGAPIETFTHVFTHYRLEATVYAKEWSAKKSPDGNGRWFTREEIENEAVPAPIKERLLRWLPRLPQT